MTDRAEGLARPTAGVDHLAVRRFPQRTAGACRRASRRRIDGKATENTALIVALVFLLEEQFALQDERPADDDRFPLLESGNDLDHVTVIDAGLDDDPPVTPPLGAARRRRPPRRDA